MNGLCKCALTLLILAAVSLAAAFSPVHAVAAPLVSQHFSSDVNAAQVMAGTPYDMNDPSWILATNQNRNTFAYKVFTGLFMLGYQTEMGYMYGLQDQQLRAIKAFQTRNGLPVTTELEDDCLALMDQQLVTREQTLAAGGQTFPLYGHMQQLHSHDISKDTLATIYGLPMSVLPHHLQMSSFETVQCIVGQCDGTIKDAQGIDLSIFPAQVDVASDYRFVGAYFDQAVANARLPSAAVHVQTVLHEYGHYLDGHLYQNPNRPNQPLFGAVDTTDFSSISYDMSACSNGCCPRRSADPMEWVTKYAFNPGYGGCGAGSAVVQEDWAESFSMYVGSGRAFRSAALTNGVIAQKYAWLKNNVFMGLEYDTGLPRGLESGCNDVYGEAAALPGYAKCDDNYLWDFTLPLLAASVRTAPTLFTLPALTGVEINTVTSSAGITVTGINLPSPVSINGGEYAINGGAYGAAPGTVNNGDNVVVRQTSSASYNTRTDAVLTIGGVSGTFSVTTRTPTQPTISGTPLTTIITGLPYSFTPTATNATSFTVSATLPPGLAFDPATGTISGTPSTPGSYGPIVISAVNGNLTAALPGFTIQAKAPAGSFSQSGSLANGRTQHTATLLANGKVLVTGGYDENYATRETAELYDPATDSWSKASPLLSPRAQHTATLLGDGTVLVTGGYDDTYATMATAELYDPMDDRWTALPPMAASRASHTATLFPSGLVLVAGGMADSGAPLAKAELYDPATGNWHAATPMSGARAYQSAILLQNGLVLVTGGYDADIAVSPGSELYDPLHNTWSPAASMQQARVVHAALLLPDGTVLACGGYDDNYAITATAERYDPVADRWNAASPMAAQRAYHSATLLNNGLVLAAGGLGTVGPSAAAEVYDPTVNTWTAAGPMAAPQTEQSATLLTSGRVLLAGGSSNVASAVTDTQLYNGGTNPDYGVNFLSGDNGSVTGITAQRIAPGGSATTVFAVPATGYRFVNWTGTGGFAGTTANPLKVTGVTHSMTITANFAPPPVDGACGESANAVLLAPPVTGLCTTGTASAVSSSGQTWSWNCGGIYGGTNASCSATLQIGSETSLPDGVVTSGGTSPTVVDVLAVLRSLVGLEALTLSQKSHADVAPLGSDGKPRGDGVVDLEDIILILRRAVGLLSW